jgi:hypothetical protein
MVVLGQDQGEHSVEPVRTDPASRAYYDRKRAEGKHHRQAVLGPARRRLNVLWAMLRDHTPYENSTATAA